MTVSVQNYINTISETSLQMAAAAGIGYICARAFTSINPLNAAIFSAVSECVRKFTIPVFNKIFGGYGANQSSRFVGAILQVITTVAASSAISNALGYGVTINAGIAVICSVVAGKMIYDLGMFLATAAALS